MNKGSAIKHGVEGNEWCLLECLIRVEWSSLGRRADTFQESLACPTR